jgi:hypothetical protein
MIPQRSPAATVKEMSEKIVEAPKLTPTPLKEI